MEEKYLSFTREQIEAPTVTCLRAPPAHVTDVPRIDHNCPRPGLPLLP